MKPPGAPEVKLHVGDVEGVEIEPVLTKHGADLTHGLRSRQITHRGNDAILHLESPHGAEPFRVGEIRHLVPVHIRLAEELPVRGVVPPRRPAVAGEPQRRTGVYEGPVEPPDGGAVFVAECHAVAGGTLRRRHQVRLHVRHQGRGLHVVEDLVHGALRPAGGIRRGDPAVERRQVLHARGRLLHERLQQEVVKEIVPPDVHDERQRGTELCDVGEVLVGAHAGVRAALQIQRLQPVHHLEVARLVGDEVVGIEVPARLADPLHQRAEERVRKRAGRELRRQRLGAAAPRQKRRRRQREPAAADGPDEANAIGHGGASAPAHPGRGAHRPRPCAGRGPAPAG